MRIHAGQSTGSERGYVLLMVMCFTGISFLALGGILGWTSNNANMTDRNNQYYNTVSAAEAATEKVLGRISYDYQTQGESEVANHLDDYEDLRPLTSESSFWSDYEFSDGQGNVGKTYVVKTANWSTNTINSQYRGLIGYSSSYRIISKARQLNARFNIPVAVQQDIQLTSLPIFQMAIFGNIDLEINPGATMRVTGRVHGNSEIYYHPDGAALTFGSDVTAVGNLHPHEHPNDPNTGRAEGTTTFDLEHDSKVASLTLPIGTNNGPNSVHAILEVPPSDEDVNSPMGKQRYYNKADIVILLKDSGLTAKSGSYNNFSVEIPWMVTNNILRTNVSFVNKRENKTVKAIEIDVGNLVDKWTLLNSTIGRDVRTLYIADQRTCATTNQPGIRVVNGATLPPQGLTIASPDPIYVKGHYNAPSTYQGTSNTTLAKPASLVGDAITVLSSAWNDSYGGDNDLARRVAVATTVNAAFLAGIVPSALYSGVKKYSGGVENFPRFLENWTGKTMTYNGSMVIMFHSKIATNVWGGNAVYSPPPRNWTFDLNYLDVTKLPPGTPEFRAVKRGQWTMFKPEH